MTDGPIAEFVNALRRLAPRLTVTIDAADDPDGETFLDLSEDGFTAEVSHRADSGFGIYVKPGLYGQRPDEVYKTAAKAAQRIVRLRNSFREDGELKYLTLLDMRLHAGRTQVEVASALGIKQPSVQRIERRGNVQIETLAKHIQAMGGRLEMSVVFDDMTARLELSALKTAKG
jgi:hypothetical protein